MKTKDIKELIRVIRGKEFKRNPIWTESIAVGSKSFVEGIAFQIRNRIRLEQKETDDGTWCIREAPVEYGMGSYHGFHG